MLLRRRNRQVIDLNELSASQMQGVRGADIAMIFQEPMTSLNPVFPVGEQIAESIRLHLGRTQLVEIDNLTVATAQQHPLAGDLPARLLKQTHQRQRGNGFTGT
ncbi:hypothetical protein A3N48_00605 [Enterobacter hormaechei subsp. steigerwaltii]|nr:hypothetical protein A3N48_00605 [Enterobacter hormaechei subsp. steigerwaltii]